MSLYLEFPPLTHYVQHAPFSWAAFALFSLIALLIIFAIIALYFPHQPRRHEEKKRYPFPRWGWLSLCALLLFWFLAWTRPGWLKPWQSFTFTLLWVSYILLTNAITCWRADSCQVTHRPRELIALFPASALFWWYFEYLNRFVQNWYYTGMDAFTPIRYVLHCTLAFSTVLPAIMSTMELLETFPALKQTRCQMKLRIFTSKRQAWMMSVLAALCLMGIAIWPDYFFPVIWFLPMFILVSLLALFGHKTILSRLEHGEWHPIALAMLAASVCGMFWEMWNYYSDPKWNYSVPFVNRFHIFAMPLLGYLGYLPFGLACLVVADQVRGIFSHLEDTGQESNNKSPTGGNR